MSAENFFTSTTEITIVASYAMYAITIWIGAVALVLMWRTQGCNRNLSLLLANMILMSVLFIIYFAAFQLQSFFNVAWSLSAGSVCEMWCHWIITDTYLIVSVDASALLDS